MVENPFANQSGEFLVLVNAENQHSIWPSFVEVPEGWSAVHGPDSRQSCLDHVEANWTDMRPKSLIDAMNAQN
ncbi:MbtH family protein [Streptomyces sp. NBC_01483]